MFMKRNGAVAVVMLALILFSITISLPKEIDLIIKQIESAIQAVLAILKKLFYLFQKIVNVLLSLESEFSGENNGSYNYSGKT